MTVGFHPSFYQFRFTSPSPPSVDLCHPFETEGGRSGDVGITNGDTDFLMRYLGSTMDKTLYPLWDQTGLFILN